MIEDLKVNFGDFRWRFDEGNGTWTGKKAMRDLTLRLVVGPKSSVSLLELGSQSIVLGVQAGDNMVMNTEKAFAEGQEKMWKLMGWS